MKAIIMILIVAAIVCLIVALFVAYREWPRPSSISGPVGGDLRPSRHWVMLADSKRKAQVYVRDSDGSIQGKVLEHFPNLEPGMWYAETSGGEVWGRYPSRLLAIAEVERRLDGVVTTRLEEDQAK